jgi:stage IV sporulation protein FB
MFNIPITISPFFWVFAIFIGWINSTKPLEILVWVFIIFISILIHELGHALVSIFFKQKARIEIAPFGGVTLREGPKLSLGKEFIVVLAGPLFGFSLFLIGLFVLPLIEQKDSILHFSFKILMLVNLLWTILNLVPVLPLDGGHLLRIILEKLFGFKGVKGVHLISFILALLLTLVAFAFGQIFIGILFFMLAFSSYRSLKQVNQMTLQDQDFSLQEEFEEAEKKLILGNKEEALKDFAKIRQKSNEGMIYNIATETQALMMLEDTNVSLEKKKEIYNLLLSLPKVSQELIPTLHRLSFENGDFAKTLELADEAYQLSPLSQTALINSMANSLLLKVKPAIGWLECALAEEDLNVEAVLQKKEFDPIRNDSEFIKLFSGGN